MAHHPLDRRRVEEVGRVLQAAREPARRLAERQRQVELRRPALRAPRRARASPLRGAALPRRVLQRANITWKSGVRLRSRSGFSSSTSFSNGRSWCA